MSTTRPATELDYEDTIIQAAELAGWIVHTERTSRTKNGWATAVKGSPGYPDITMVHPRRQIIAFLELKRPPNKPTSKQLRWLGALTMASPDPKRVVVAVVRLPEQLTSLLDWVTGREGASPPS